MISGASLQKTLDFIHLSIPVYSQELEEETVVQDKDCLGQWFSNLSASECLEGFPKPRASGDFPGGLVVKTPHCLCRGHRFDP